MTVLVKVAGASEAALRANAARLADHLADHPRLDPGAVAWTACTARADLSERAAVVAGTLPDIVAGLRLVASAEGAIRGTRRLGAVPRVGFVAPGHGIKITGLLADGYGPIHALASLVDALPEPSRRLLTQGGTDADALLLKTEFAQPALYALAVGLGTWWRSVGVVPTFLTGHSVGAYAAAALAGVFSTEDGARLIAGRARLMGALPSTGAMTAIIGGPEELKDVGLVEAGRVTVAVLNSARNTVISGRGDDASGAGTGGAGCADNAASHPSRLPFRGNGPRA